MSKGPPAASSAKSKKIENVLILQGGGSLGAFGCGVFKALAKRNIKIDIVAGTSIGGVNAAIIAGGGKNGERPEQSLEQFWMELSDSFVNLVDGSGTAVPGLVAESLLSYYYGPHPLPGRDPLSTRSEKGIRFEQLRSFASSALFGNDRMFKPRWRPEYAS